MAHVYGGKIFILGLVKRNKFKMSTIEVKKKVYTAQFFSSATNIFNSLCIFRWYIPCESFVEFLVSRIILSWILPSKRDDKVNICAEKGLPSYLLVGTFWASLHIIGEGEGWVVGFCHKLFFFILPEEMRQLVDP